MRINLLQAASFAGIALEGVSREYPNKPDHTLFSSGDARTPRDLHPAFFGCYDWHSAVHSHWMLARLMRLFPKLSQANAIAAVLADHFSARNIESELAYASHPDRATFERPYGWAWMFRLVQELSEWADPQSVQWTTRLRPFAELFAGRLIAFLPRQRYPIRAGVHSNTAFALGFAWDYAKAAGNAELASAVEKTAQRFFGNDRDVPARWEPNGNDFFSPSLIEADLMRRLLEPRHFARWLEGFLPGLATGQPANLLEPAVVSDRSDAQGVHLDGLNLSRAWCLRAVADTLDSGDARQSILLGSADAHLKAGLAHVASGDFLGQHWLGTFAVYALTSRS
jgi:hypothetical protein